MSSSSLPVPVISVGNLTVGGTGKTPIVIAIAKALEELGLKVAVLSRGYAGQIKTSFNEADSPDYGDEPYMIQQNLLRGKVFVGKNRVFAGRKAIEKFHPDVIILDDGFQHIALKRDLNILLVDGELGFGNSHLLPVGPLREPINEIRRADWLLLTKHISSLQEKNIYQVLESLNLKEKPKVAYCPFRVNGVIHPTSTDFIPSSEIFNNKTLVLISAIAQPQSFESMIRRNCQATVLNHFVFPDHDRFLPHSLASFESYIKEHNDSLILTTEKDWVKLEKSLPKAYHEKVYILSIEPMFDWNLLIKTVLPDIKHLKND